MLGLPRTASAPFCPSEVRGSVAVSLAEPFWRRALRFAGPGLLVSVGYMDPGNWATDIEAGSKHGYALLWVVLASSLAAVLLQTLSLRLGIVAGRDLARACRDRYRLGVNAALWLMAELAIIACDVAEVVGTALALHLLLGVTLLAGIAITALDTIIVLGLKGHGFRQVEAIILGLVASIGVCLAVELVLIGPQWKSAMSGLAPSPALLQQPGQLYLAIGILGATVMPHNLYLHSSIVQTRRVADTDAARRDGVRLATLDAVVSLLAALVVNAAILILAASAFHAMGRPEVADIADAHRLLEPVLGSTLAPVLFGVGLLAAGQSSTFTGTIAGQVLMEGFLNMKIPCWQRRLITRSLALLPAFVGVAWMGEAGVDKLLVASQVVLGAQLPFAIWPLIRLTSDPTVMGIFANGLVRKAVAWLLFVAISAANIWFVMTIV